MNVSQAGLTLIKQFEGLKTEAYRCPAGVPTIGYGHTKDVHMGGHLHRRAGRYLAEGGLSVG
jgi:GH24 family phage-related lysozyme (muramidase)